MNISMDLLQTFVSYVETESVVTTAEHLGMSQPAVSAHLKRLHEQLPVPPLITKGRGKELTAYGRTLYDAVKHGMKEIDRGIESTNQRYMTPEQVTLRVGVRNELLPRIAQILEFPGKLVFTASSTKQSTEDLLENKIDIAITTAAADSPYLVAKVLFSEPVKLACPKKWMQDAPSLEAFREKGLAATLPILSYRADPPFLPEWSKWCDLKMNQLKIAVQCENWFAISSMIGAGRGYSIIPASIPTTTDLVTEITVPTRVIAETKIYALFRKEFYKIPPLSHLKILGFS